MKHVNPDVGGSKQQNAAREVLFGRRAQYSNRSPMGLVVNFEARTALELHFDHACLNPWLLRDLSE
jgi:hypothetical protein